MCGGGGGGGEREGMGLEGGLACGGERYRCVLLLFLLGEGDKERFVGVGGVGSFSGDWLNIARNKLHAERERPGNGEELLADLGNRRAEGKKPLLDLAGGEISTAVRDAGDAGDGKKRRPEGGERQGKWKETSKVIKGGGDHLRACNNCRSYYCYEHPQEETGGGQGGGLPTEYKCLYVTQTIRGTVGLSCGEWKKKFTIKWNGKKSQ